MPITTDKFIFPSISKKILLAINGEHPRKLLVTIMHRLTDNGDASPRGYIYTYSTTHIRLREHH